MKLNNKFMLESTVQLSKIISSQIAKVKVYVMYAGKNRNHTHFSKEMIEQKLVPSMYGMPIIGEYNKDKKDFGGHGGKTTITDDGISFEQTTVAYGFIPESSQIKWETVTEVNGTEREYLVCDGYVWYKRFPEVESILEEPKGQSMEIEIGNAVWSDEMQAYDIMDAEFTGACILGVEPCFESAKIGKFSLEKMKYELSEMTKELKEVLKSEVSTEMTDLKDTVVEETVETVEEVIETPVEETVEPQEEKEEVVTEEQTEEEPIQEESKEEETQVVEESKEESVYEVQEEVTETKEEEPTQEETQEAVQEIEVQEEVQAEFSKEEIEAMKSELEELRAYKKAQEKVAKEEILKSFASELSEEELAPVKEKIEELTETEIETQCFALLGKKKMNYSLQQPEQKSEVVAISDKFEQEDSSLPLWMKAVQKHTSRKQY